MCHIHIYVRAKDATDTRLYTEFFHFHYTENTIEARYFGGLGTSNCSLSVIVIISTRFSVPPAECSNVTSSEIIFYTLLLNPQFTISI
jgi:hypothetical protein